MKASTTSVSVPDGSVAISDIHSPGNIRSDAGDVEELVASIRSVGGLLQPLVVRDDGNGGYDLLDGHRRLEALVRLGMNRAPVHVVPAGVTWEGEEERILVQLVANLQRLDLDAVEEAQGFAQLKAHGWKQKEIASRVGRSEAHVSKRLALVDLPDQAFDLHAGGRIGSDDLYQLTKVVAAGGDLEPILTQLADPDSDTGDTPYRAVEVEQMVTQAVRAANTESEVTSRRAELEADGVTVLDPDPDRWPPVPRNRLGWEIDVDVDAHAKEPCHAVCLYTSHGAVYESYHCTIPTRHGPDGDSKLKVPGGAKASTNASKAADRERRALLKRLAELAGEVLAGRPPSREKILDRVAVLYLDAASAEVHKRAILWLGLAAELGDEYKGLNKLYEEADTANRLRILLAAVLAHGQTIATNAATLGDPDPGHFEFLAALGRPFDPKDLT